jgi:hypothetical protein
MVYDSGMVDLFTAKYMLFWALALGAALFLPIRRLVWVLYVRRAEKDGPADEAKQTALKRRASYSSALICFVFSYFYTAHLFSGR